MRSSSLASYLTQSNAEIFAKKHSGREFVETVVEKLDRLTSDETRMVAARILEVIYGVVCHMKVIMKGEKTNSACHALIVEFLSF